MIWNRPKVYSNMVYVPNHSWTFRDTNFSSIHDVSPVAGSQQALRPWRPWRLKAAYCLILHLILKLIYWVVLTSSNHCQLFGGIPSLTFAKLEAHILLLRPYRMKISRIIIDISDSVGCLRTPKSAPLQTFKKYSANCHFFGKIYPRDFLFPHFVFGHTSNWVNLKLPFFIAPFHSASQTFEKPLVEDWDY